MRLLKKQYSESVIRKSLYWLSDEFSWELDEDEDAWIICFELDSQAAAYELNRLLNDFLLREQLDQQTGAERQAVILSALKRIAGSNA